ncbi:unnamed protein product [Prunus armeniaca]
MEKIAFGTFDCRPRLSTSSASRSTVNGLFLAALEAESLVGCPRFGVGSAPAVFFYAGSPFNRRSRSARVCSLGSVFAVCTGGTSDCRFFFFS